jgi:hypothetical protein
VKFEHGLLLDHHPSDPSIGHRQQHKQADDGTSAEGKELNAKSKSEEHTGSEYIDGPFQTHVGSSGCMYLICIQKGVSLMCRRVALCSYTTTREPVVYN